jgi:hypothetical protein
MLPIRQSHTTAVSEAQVAGESLRSQRLPALIHSLFQPPPAGLIALLRGPNLVLSLATVAAGLYALKGQRVLLVDAGNSTDPYIVSRLAHAARQDPRPVLSRVHVIRTFTVHQLAALAFRRLERFIRDRAPGLVILSGATSLFADANVPFKEASWLLREIAAEVKRQAQAGCKVLVTAADPPVESGRTRLHLPWLDVASRSIRVDPSTSSGQAPSTSLRQGLVFRYEKPFSSLVELLPADQLAAFLR